MALKRDATYPGRFVASSIDHPQGAFKNRTSPTAQDGSYLEAQWANDWDGFFARAMNIAGVTPNGTADTGSASQLYDALVAAMPGRLLNTQTFTTSGVYTATPGTKKVRIRAVGGGGAGGSAGTNSSTTISVGSSGGSGGYGEAILTSGFDGQSVTVGNGGIANIGGTGGTGGNTLFGSLLAVGGGGGGAITQVSTSTIFNYSGQGASGGAMTGTGLVVAVRGTVGPNGLAFGTAGLPLAAIGAASFFGGGSAQSAANIVGTDSVSYGSGGPGTATTASNTAKLAGAGAKGVLIIEEYS